MFLNLGLLILNISFNKGMSYVYMFLLFVEE